ncbi:BQ5605_C001g00946 [Microbotryum silenes-dioicae]|uniref:BQ5605_C001g00946 protein n=1 Tax=Microbotryum silenes-dioicae TaxID=796604 RepID=A0A2X0P7F8_9BASI|nr:BQ5605_C001g00946 [Microbotryum silenes-dioicae]
MERRSVQATSTRRRGNPTIHFKTPRRRSVSHTSPDLRSVDDGYGSSASVHLSTRRLRPSRLLLVVTILLAIILISWHSIDRNLFEKKRWTRPARTNQTILSARSDRTTAVTEATRSVTSRVRKAALVRAATSPFAPSSDPLPVHHEERLINYANHPMSPHRPSPKQFLLSPAARFDDPVIGIITATNNPRPEILRETAATVLGQSLQNFVWAIVDDHTDNSESLDAIADLAKDPRVKVLKNTGSKGLAATRNVALKYLLERPNGPPKYLVSLDDDDMLEFTCLEKTAWMLESNADWQLGGFYYIKHGPGANESVTTGLHSHDRNLNEGNYVPNAAMYRSQAVVDSGCKYDEQNFASGGEDWDFWMCLAENGFWGGTALEPLFWYRANDQKFRASRWGDTFSGRSAPFIHMRETVQKKHRFLDDASNFPHRVPKHSSALERIVWDQPFESNLATSDKSIMFVIPWLYLGGADVGAVRMIRLYAEKGYRVTVVCTLFDPPAGIELRPEALQWTHDVHVLPSFLRARDFPRYFKYLVESRGINQIVLSNSQLTYEMMPALVEQMPDVEFIDVSRKFLFDRSTSDLRSFHAQYLHNEAYDGWKSGGYPQYSTILRRHLARTITCSHYLRDYLIARGHAPERVGVVKLGIEMERFFPVTLRERNNAKATFLHLPSATVVITIVGRLDPQKRPLLVPSIVAKLLDAVEEDFVVIMVGDGPLEAPLKSEIVRHSIGDYVRVLGGINDPYPYLAASDIFMLPSRSEGVSIAVAEAMAMGLPVLTAREGALPEQLGDYTGKASASSLGGILIDHKLKDRVDASLYADALVKLIKDTSLRRKLGTNGRRMVEKDMDWRTSLVKLFDEVELAKNPPRTESDTTSPHPAAYFAIQTLLLEARRQTDFFEQYPANPAPEADDDDEVYDTPEYDIPSDESSAQTGDEVAPEGVSPSEEKEGAEADDRDAENLEGHRHGPIIHEDQEEQE